MANTVNIPSDHPFIISDYEKDELTQLLKERYGYDFSGYASASLLRRITRFSQMKHIDSFFELKTELLNNEKLFSEFILEVTVNVTEMFRDPEFFTALKTDVFPNLKTYPYRKIWHAGCSSGEEVYSLSILIKEAGMLDSSIIYATDININAINQAKEAIYPLKLMQEYTRNYIRAGGEASFSEYYSARYEEAILSAAIKKNIMFSLHNLVSDGSFNEFNLIICRNVLIYFNKELQDRVLGLFYESLAPLGYLALGSRESLLFSKYKSYFQVIDKNNKIYRKIN